MDSTSEHTRRASSFGAQASAYAEYRPSYPDQAVRWALEPVTDREQVRVCDLAAGTGKLAEVVARQGYDVLAVEPDLAMLAELRRRLPGVPALNGRAEEIPLPDGSVDAVVVGQAFHWFDVDRALGEIARVLRPGGVVAGLWNFEDDQEDWVAGLAAVYGRLGSIGQWRGDRTFPAHERFGASESAEFAYVERRTTESLVGAISTQSTMLVMPDGDRARLLGLIRDYLRGRPETASGEFGVPIIAGVIRAVRLS
ncbi:class I SAM-dependent methyltransferase [Actinopolymorpha alba]|uniref:class I SAM-dependent methyltransferase n=1 Tax=Actinopolymorpha alba TaxID=533267 RepID=UPI00035E94EB|nr:class I SAM-dependent methyltransferase [Actinopolymorpha alba]